MIFNGIQKTSMVDYPDEISTIIFVSGCNFRCPYCHNSVLVNNDSEIEISEDEVLNFLKNRRKIIKAIVISGGEPTLYGKELIKFIEKLKDLDFLVKLDTNGTKPEILEELISKKLIDYIAMDIKAPINKYKQLTKVNLNIENIKKSINLIKSSNIDYEFRTTVAKELLSKEDILEIIKEISPCKKYYLQNFKDSEGVLEGIGVFHSVDFLEEIKEKFPLINIR